MIDGELIRSMDESRITEYMRIKDSLTVLPLQRFISYVSRHTILSAPIRVEISLTNACNQYCFHCSNARRTGHSHVQEFKTNWLKQIISCSPILCILTGGEPTLHNNFADVVRMLKDAGIIVTILSNGTTWDTKSVRFLLESGFSNNDRVQISLDAATPSRYFDCRRTDDYHKVLDTIFMLSDAGIAVDVHCVPTVHTIECVKDIYSIANNRGAHSFSTAPVVPLGRASISDFPSIEQLIDVEIDLIRLSTCYNTKYLGSLLGTNCSYMHLIDCEVDENVKVAQKPDKYRCEAGMSSAYIDENGDVYTCVYASEHPFTPLGNLSKNSFLDIWSNSRNDPSRIGVSVIGSLCAQCEHWGICSGGCFGVSSINSGKIQMGHDTRCKKIMEDLHCERKK